MMATNECVACGDPCPDYLRWCSTACCYAEDGYPWDLNERWTITPQGQDAIAAYDEGRMALDEA